MNFKNNYGFTLMEVLVAATIVATLLGLALPPFTMHLERTRSAEAIQILGGLLKAQTANFYENSVYSGVLANLDIDIPPSQNFNTPTVATTDPIASIQRQGGSYTLHINADGTMTCTPAGALCTKLGY